MELHSYQFLSALLAIVVIDLVLAGDNAIVIALAARTLPKALQKKAIVWGTVGAIAVRIVMTLVVVWLLSVPGLRFVGGLLLIWIAYKLLAADNHDDDHEVSLHLGSDVQHPSFWSALRTIVVADAVMGLDNVLGVAGAAKGSFVLVVLGLAISIPIMVWGSTLILKWVERFPAIIYVGAGVLAWTSATMIIHEPKLQTLLDDFEWADYAIYAVIFGGVLGAGYLVNTRRKKLRSHRREV
ncbi:MAG: TerC family protein [Betaproteobacteria bacterium]